MQVKKKVVYNSLFLLIVFLLTIYGVFHGQDLNQMFEAIKNVNMIWLLPGVFLVLFFIWGESIIIW